MLAAHIAGSSTVYSTIQAAVDAAPAGATITVDAGNYAELVTVYKPLTIEGAQAGVDARTNTRAAAVAVGDESIITGSTGSTGVSTSFYIAANDVTIDGFTVQGATAQYNYGAGIVMAPNISGAHIVNDIIRDNMTGLLLSNDSASDPALIQYDYFLNNNGTGSNNSRGIYSDGSVSGGLLTNVVIDSNAFITNVFHTGAAHYEGCIALEGMTTGDQQNITITNNSMDGDGKLLLYNCQNVDIEHNVMTHSLDQWSGTFRFEGGDINVTVKYNTIYDNTGPGLSVDSKGFPADDSGFVVEDNNFYNNNLNYNNKYSLAVTASAYDGVFDATNNYWGAANGPSGQGSGSGDMAWGNGTYLGGANSGWGTGAGNELVLTPFSSAPIGSLDTPYYVVPENTGAPIQAEDFNQGGKGNGYYTTNNINAAGQYRTAEYVSIQAATDTGGGYDVTSTVAGEWLDYTVNVSEAGTYDLEIRLAESQTTEGQFHVDLDGNNVTGTLTAPNTGGGQTWQTVTFGGINITAGTHVLRLAMDAVGSGGYVANFNWLELVPGSASTPVAPAAPTNVTAVATSATTVKLTWQESSLNQTGFVIQRSTDGVNFTQVGTASATATTYSNTNAVAGTSYTYRVYAASAAGSSGYSGVATVTTPIVATAPTGLAAVAVSATTVNLTWTDTAAGVETGFIIQRSTSGGAYTQVGTTVAGVTSFSDTSAVSGTSYSYRVYATSAGGNSAYSSIATATTPAIATAPTGLTAVAISTTQVNLAWTDTAVGVETGFIIQRSANGAAYMLIGTTPLGATSFSDGGAVAGTSYDYRVYATSAGGNSPYSVVASVTTAPMATAPTGLAAIAISGTQINLAWTDTAAGVETGFIIQRSDNGGAYVQVGATAAGVTSFSDNSAVAATSYSYRVYATSAGGTSLSSLVSTAATPAVATAPTELTAVAVSATQVDLSWADTAAGVETGFIIQRSTNGGAFVQIGTTAVGVTIFNDTAAAAATDYIYCVLATSAGGNSAASSSVSATTPAAASVLPPSWGNRSVGNANPLSTASESAGVYTVVGAGAGIGGTADALDYVCQSLTGNGTIVAHLDTAQTGTNEAGIMIRETVDAGSKEVAVAVTPNRIRFVHRGKVGAVAGTSSTRVAASVPQWGKLTRKKNTFTAYDSVDRIHWKKIGSATIKMNASVSIGLAAASGTTTTLNYAAFSDVSVVG